MAYVVQDIKLIPNGEAFTFIPISAFTMFLDNWTSILEKFKPFKLHPKDIPQCDNDSIDYKVCTTLDMLNFTMKQIKLLGFESGWLYNTSRDIEGKYVNLMEKLKKKIKHFAIGPFHEVVHNTGSKSKHQCLEWLYKQEKGSVIYVSFEDDNGDIMKENQLPQGYEEKVKNKGIVVRDWASQVEILAHKSVGGFMSHCGWNSCIESLSMGVPIATWPMHSDQPRNAILVSEVLKVGVVVRDWAHRSELVMSNSIENASKRLMVSKEGKEMKERAVKLGGAIRGSTTKGGVSCLERDAFIAYITRDVNSDSRIKFRSTQNGSGHIRSQL
ncbi:Zeatin O-glucosyltransferase [Bienertia sinuspersici]